jgi:uncharacterized protein DUF3443
MTFVKVIAVIGMSVTLGSCTSSDSNNASSTPSLAGACKNATVGASSSLVTTSTTNVIPVYIADTGTTGSVGYTNEPLVSVTICSPNHTSPSQCQTISNILLDTGSFGLRVFNSALNSNVALSQVTTVLNGQSYNVAQCAVFGSGADWGAVKKADVILGSQTAANISVHVIDSTFASMPTSCSSLSPDTDPCTAGFNGILGVGPFSYDCGADCASTNVSVNPGMYFACSGSSCDDVYAGACSGGECAVPISTAQQVVNPVAMLGSGFNNGISLMLPAIPLSGASQVSGSMTIGIGTTAANTPASSVVIYPADSNGLSDQNGIDFETVFSGTTYGLSSNKSQAFLDSGSNGLFFPNTPNFALCSDGTFYCPASATNLSATIAGFGGSPQIATSFTVQNIYMNTNSADRTMAGQQSSVFDWGLPFFFGRTVFVGIDGAAATFNSGSATGPYWAF